MVFFQRLWQPIEKIMIYSWSGFNFTQFESLQIRNKTNKYFIVFLIFQDFSDNHFCISLSAIFWQKTFRILCEVQRSRVLPFIDFIFIVFVVSNLLVGFQVDLHLSIYLPLKLMAFNSSSETGSYFVTNSKWYKFNYAKMWSVM